MKKLIYAVYDSKVEIYEQPFFLRTKGEAIRSWQKVTNDQQTKFYEHPEDYTLFELGVYDEETGSFQNHKTPVSIGVAIEFKKSENSFQGKSPGGQPG